MFSKLLLSCLLLSLGIHDIHKSASRENAFPSFTGGNDKPFSTGANLFQPNMFSKCKFCEANFLNSTKTTESICENCCEVLSIKTEHFYYVKYKKTVDRTQKCLQCKKTYLTNHKSQKFCSIKCAARHNGNIVKNSFSGEPEPIKISIFKIHERDNFKCIYCGKSSIEDGVKLHIDHVYPLSKGGSNHLYNLATCCEKCNLSKHARELSRKNIYRIWKRNQQLNLKFKDNFNELTKVFNDYYLIRNNRFINN